MSEISRVNERRKISLKRAYQAMNLSGKNMMEIARDMGPLNVVHKKDPDDKGCYKALSKALATGFMSGKMLDKFCKAVKVDPYVISGKADKDLEELYERLKDILADYCTLEEYKDSLNLKLYPYNGDFPRINEDYKSDIYSSSGLIGAYNKLMLYFGVKFIDKQSIDDEPGCEKHSLAYYALMDKILEAIDKCIDEYNEAPQKLMTCELEGTKKLIYTFRNELYQEGYLDIDVEED